MVRYIYLSFAGLLFLFASCESNKPTNCREFKNGNFKMVFNGATTIIKRKDAEQVEYFDGYKAPVHFIVRWIDDCSYTLTPKDEAFIKFANLPKNATITVKINSTTATSYTQTSTSNFNDQSMTCTITKVQ